MPGIWTWSSTWGGPPFNPLWGTVLLCGSSEKWKHCSVPSKYWESPCQVLLSQKEWPQRVCLVAAWSVSEGNVVSLTGPQNRRSGEKCTKRGEPGPQRCQVFLSWFSCLPEGGFPPGPHPSSSSYGNSTSSHSQSDEWADTPVCPGESRIFISFHFWPFCYSANPQGLGCIIISEDQKWVFRVSTNPCLLDLMVLEPILILIALLKYIVNIFIQIKR